MTPYYEQDGISIYHGDSREVLPCLKGDAVLTDPPFGVRGEDWDRMDAQEFARFSMQWLALARAAAPELATFCTQESAIRPLCEMLFTRVRQLIWHKPLGSQYAGASERHLWFAYEPILHCYEPTTWSVVEPKDAAVGRLIRQAREASGLSRGAVDIAVRGKKTGLCYRWEEGACLPTPEQAARLKEVIGINGEFDATLAAAYQDRNETIDAARVEAAKHAADKLDVFTYRTITDGVHPCEKPVGLMVDILTTALAGCEHIIDPFGGSGSVAIAARELGRRCTMVEQDERYCEVAANRLRQGILWSATA